MDNAERTKLLVDSDPDFADWKQQNAPNDSGMDYDLYGAYQAGIGRGADDHFPDTYKLPGHPRFSIESKYYQPGMPAGRWEGEGQDAEYIRMDADTAAKWVKDHPVAQSAFDQYPYDQDQDQQTPDQTAAAPQLPAAPVAAPEPAAPPPPPPTKFGPATPPDAMQQSGLTPLQVPGGTWSSMAPAIIPAILGAITGGRAPLSGAIAGLTGGAGAIESSRDKALQYNNQLAQIAERQRLAREESVRQQRHLDLAEDQAQRQAEEHKVNMVRLKSETDAMLRDQGAINAKADELRRTKGDATANLFLRNPAAFTARENDEIARADLEKRQAPILDAFISSHRLDVGKGVTGSDLVHAFGDKALEHVRSLEQMAVDKSRAAAEWARVGIEKDQAARAMAEMTKPQVILGDKDSGYVITQHYDLAKKTWVNEAKKLNEFLNVPADYLTNQATRGAAKTLLESFDRNEFLKMKYQGNGIAYLASPEGQAGIAFLTGSSNPANLAATTEAARQRQARNEAAADKQTREYWAANERGFSSDTDANYRAYKNTEAGSARYQNNLRKLDAGTPARPSADEAVGGAPITVAPPGTTARGPAPAVPVTPRPKPAPRATTLPPLPGPAQIEKAVQNEPPGPLTAEARKRKEEIEAAALENVRRYQRSQPTE